MKSILFIITSANVTGTNKIKTGYEFSEIADPYIEFSNANYNVDFASIRGGQTPEDGYDENYPNNKIFKNSSGFKRLNFSHKLSDIDFEAYEAIFFPGGLGPMIDMVNNNLLKTSIAKFYEDGKIVATVCHGAVALLNVKLKNGALLLKGKNVTCFSQPEEDLKGHTIEKIIPFFLDKAIINEGAKYSKADPFEKHVVIDGNLITGQNPASAIGVAKAIISKLST
jgi:putative cofactor-binding repeat protein